MLYEPCENLKRIDAHTKKVRGTRSGYSRKQTPPKHKKANSLKHPSLERDDTSLPSVFAHNKSEPMRCHIGRDRYIFPRIILCSKPRAVFPND
mmetsp:Transcript_56866/g.115779  ORF Transcript_56866/g.115779 Transcript_56866/m.115779 type:complete len:93 (-) Transcript_56866:1281-1559(-)